MSSDRKRCYLKRKVSDFAKVISQFSSKIQTKFSKITCSFADLFSMESLNSISHRIFNELRLLKLHDDGKRETPLQSLWPINQFVQERPFFYFWDNFLRDNLMSGTKTNKPYRIWNWGEVIFNLFPSFEDHWIKSSVDGERIDSILVQHSLINL